MAHVSDFRVGMFIQNSESFWNFSRPEGLTSFVGTVLGLTVNAYGEPVLNIHMVCRRFTSHDTMIALGYTPVDNALVGGVDPVFYERTGAMHPSNVTELQVGTYLEEDE